jgi:hypothetical protein
MESDENVRETLYKYAEDVLKESNENVPKVRRNENSNVIELSFK